MIPISGQFDLWLIAEAEKTVSHEVLEPIIVSCFADAPYARADDWKDCRRQVLPWLVKRLLRGDLEDRELD